MIGWARRLAHAVLCDPEGDPRVVDDALEAKSAEPSGTSSTTGEAPAPEQPRDDADAPTAASAPAAKPRDALKGLLKGLLK